MWRQWIAGCDDPFCGGMVYGYHGAYFKFLNDVWSYRPPLEHEPGDYRDLISALASVPWRPRLENDRIPGTADCLLDWTATPEQPEAPDDALVWYDVPLTFEPPAHRPRFVVRRQFRVGADGEVSIADKPAQNRTPPPPGPSTAESAARRRTVLTWPPFSAQHPPTHKTHGEVRR